MTRHIDLAIFVTVQGTAFRRFLFFINVKCLLVFNSVGLIMFDGDDPVNHSGRNHDTFTHSRAVKSAINVTNLDLPLMVADLASGNFITRGMRRGFRTILHKITRSQRIAVIMTANLLPIR